MKPGAVLAGVLCVLIVPVDDISRSLQQHIFGIGAAQIATRHAPAQPRACLIAPAPRRDVITVDWPRSAPQYTEPALDAALVADGATGDVLYARNADLKRHPASLTKMMTLYLLFEALQRGDVTLRTDLRISRHAARQSPANLDLDIGDRLPIETAIRAITVHSANDVAVAIAEALGGTEAHFAEMMTAKGQALGMRDTFYHNASGLPDELQITTANDTLILARRLAHDFPQYFSYFALPTFRFRGETYDTHDKLIGRYDGANGIKTGYTESSGFNLVSSVVRDRSHVIAVVMGGLTAHRRDLEMVRLLDLAFLQIARNPPQIPAELSGPSRGACLSVTARAI